MPATITIRGVGISVTEYSLYQEFDYVHDGWYTDSTAQTPVGSQADAWYGIFGMDAAVAAWNASAVQWHDAAVAAANSGLTFSYDPALRHNGLVVGGFGTSGLVFPPTPSDYLYVDQRLGDWTPQPNPNFPGSFLPPGEGIGLPFTEHFRVTEIGPTFGQWLPPVNKVFTRVIAAVTVFRLYFPCGATEIAAGIDVSRGGPDLSGFGLGYPNLAGTLPLPAAGGGKVRCLGVSSVANSNARTSGPGWTSNGILIETSG